ncbi:cell division protein ZapC [Photobacterium ganghwense]|uniref:Cell division protein ZapC n=1 Tax=Photobacterium ganghwense TaxID=320778 RepID=A0A0J1JX59_9GAMM|nr:cell division protein ZapC [Photobacterium ganghwense]KLV06882.1 cell division protein ZapC [Photobacterium ganghwense]PSU10585.1 cell division protein ZapC [Photobacterium ganghwense]QSV15485.1 cell division protein ZapC [Photobacterium ganghwense]
MLKPNNSWMWYYDQKHDALMLDLGEEMIFRVSIPTKNLVPCAFTRSVFTVDDASTYQTYLEGVSSLDLPAPRKVEIALNAVAANRFHKPMMPKSWFFKDLKNAHCPSEGDVVTLYTEDGQANFLVIENNGNASLCMSAEVEAVNLNNAKQMQFCDTIKVMNDRMEAFEAHVEMPVSFALVG